MKDNAPKDLIGRNFFALEPFKRFVCDITYLTGCDETWYLSVIEDLFNEEIVGWKIGEHCTAALCIETVLMMKETVENTEGCILHSDGGSTYISYDYRELLQSLGIRQSMGKKLTCYDNAKIESFNGVFKTEVHYFVPLTSFKKKHLHLSNSIDFMKIGRIAAINLNKMIPVPIGCYSRVVIKEEGDVFYRQLLYREQRFIRKNQQIIKDNASLLYKKVLKNTDSKLAKRSNDFKLLESVCKDYR